MLALVTSSVLITAAEASDVKGEVGAAVKKVSGKSGEAGIERVANFDHQVTGVAASEDGRVFVNFPRWSEDAPISVAEIKDGKAVPYPDEEWNRYRNAAPLSPADHFVCVQAMTADGKGNLWVIDPAAPNTEFIVPGGPKLVKIDLKTNKVVQVMSFGTDVAPQGSYLNDVRFSPDDKWAYITDSGATGALVVVDLTTGKGRRLLEGDVSTMPDKSVQVVVDGVTLKQPDGRGVQFAADSISIDPKGEYLYWQPLTRQGALSHRDSDAAGPQCLARAGKGQGREGGRQPAQRRTLDGQHGAYLLHGHRRERHHDAGAGRQEDHPGGRPSPALARYLRRGTERDALRDELGDQRFATLQREGLEEHLLQSLEDRSEREEPHRR